MRGISCCWLQSFRGGTSGSIKELGYKAGHKKDGVAKADHTVLVEVLISRDDPTKVIEVSQPVLYPSEPYELEGLKGTRSRLSVCLRQPRIISVSPRVVVILWWRRPRNLFGESTVS